MVQEVVHFLRCNQGGLFLDGTLGTGGHTLAIFENSPATTQVIGMDRDPQSLALARERLKPYSNRLRLALGKFGDLKENLFKLGITAVDGIVLDLGFSSFQLETLGRGFSFQREDQLDMRMDQSQGISARDWLSQTSEKELERVLREYGEERWAKRLAAKIKAAQAQKPLQTTRELAELIARAIPGGSSGRRIHPATRSFQALRIRINDELAQLNAFLNDFLETLTFRGRVCLIAYHSLEDRLIKQTFLRLEKGEVDPLGIAEPYHPEGQPRFQRVVAKPITPSPEEISNNSRARGAKLRVGERRGDAS
jgi:16S rRNA (cytosine1402-N4)-methyltransferase